MWGIENYWGFVVAALVLNITPGSDTIYILSRTLSQGAKAGIASVLGISSGILVWGLLVSLGLAAVLAQAPMLMLAIKLLGAAYIVWIAVQMWRSNDLDASSLQDASKGMSVLKTYQQGVVTNLLNPKIGLFFLAFLPQFVSHGADSAVPFLLLTATFMVTGTLWCLLLVVLAGFISKKLQQRPEYAQRLSKSSAVILGAMGVHTGISSLKEVV
ncbi:MULTISPECIES: LysE family translocator [Vitreoscilla]|uniref:LysE family translocator n=1 Tax=Vitreoscilla stercoraria TaxID=61 RepID=A0ABY4EFZ7_VITST|nr:MULTISPECIES: LysE family translocator [Vitreoscilla]AUZ06393.2 LysE type translocator [Vitreoscilla sp. C1]UOO92322.1 LysE family translocator [Vitreoscilla stercoraria]